MRKTVARRLLNVTIPDVSD